MQLSGFLYLHVCCLRFISFSTHKEPGKVIWSDGEGYYVYLPSVFIFHDFVKDAVRDTGYIKAFQDTGKIFSKYTCGVAILEMPFFLPVIGIQNYLDFFPQENRYLRERIVLVGRILPLGRYDFLYYYIKNTILHI